MASVLLSLLPESRPPEQSICSTDAPSTTSRSESTGTTASKPTDSTAEDSPEPRLEMTGVLEMDSPKTLTAPSRTLETT